MDLELKGSPLISSSSLQLHYHTSFIKEEGHARISQSKTKIKKQKQKGTTMKINMVSCYLLTESPVSSNSLNQTLVSFSSNITISPIQNAS